MTCANMMANDLATARRDFASVAPRLNNEKANLIDEYNEIKTEEAKMVKKNCRHDSLTWSNQSQKI